jgi:CubicO group peptidase (beta-lactamase class C family)
MTVLADEITSLTHNTGFSGVVSVDRAGTIEFAGAYGSAHRGLAIPNTLDTRFMIASGTKGFTALAVLGLVADGRLALDTTARSVLGKDLPLVDNAVTVEHLLGHRSGIGEFYPDHTGITEYNMPGRSQDLLNTEQYLPVLDGHPQIFEPGSRFEYSNSGYVLLGLIAERVSGTPFHDLVVERVCEPAGMRDTAFHRLDTPEARMALGYLEIDGEWRTNVYHLPIRGAGDGGIFTTVADFARFWPALFSGVIVPQDAVANMTHVHSDVPEDQMQYGLGFWLRGSSVLLEGYDPGVSFRSVHTPGEGLTYTVISNTAEGAWPITRRLAELLD